ncbi:zf-HC2 domain-containing protein [Actinomadura sp. 21ATH]|uniref:zf-HC2 domain-containing protein n=1 Tax=Actinomadura sp. 21ATH TaxID=1735444 RepID=UPI0035BEFA05
MSATIQHTDVGAYALGLLEEPDRRAFERHLSSCMACHRELGSLRGLAASLDGLPPIAEDPPPPAPPDPGVVGDLLRRRRAGVRRRRVSQALVGVAAGLVLMGGAAGLGVTVASGEREAPPVAAAENGVEALFRDGRRVSATDPDTGVKGTVAMERKLWGSRVGLRLGGVQGPLECELVAVDRAGRPHVVAGWSVPPKGYGRPGSPAPLVMQGGTALAPDEIARFEVRTIGEHRRLLTVPNA